MTVKTSAGKPIAQGPVISRRLGKSLYISNFPQKVCTYSCIYCQGGHTAQLEYERVQYYNPMDIMKAVRLELANVKDSEFKYDYLAFIPDGEPTQDSNLGAEIDLVKRFGIPIAVMTNSSLLWREEVQNDLLKADWVSLKLDAVDEETWNIINRPHKKSRFITIIEGMVEFAKVFKGTLVTETMLVEGVNDSDLHAARLAKFLLMLRPDKAYLTIPTKPPTFVSAKPPSEDVINRFYQTVAAQFSEVEYLIGYEAMESSAIGNPVDDILQKVSIKPVLDSEVREIASKANLEWKVIHELITKGELVETKFANQKYLMRKINVGYPLS